MISISSIQVTSGVTIVTVSLGGNSWQQISPSGNAPKPRGKHDAVAVKHEVFLFGGKNDSDVHGDMWAFDTGNSDSAIANSNFCKKNWLGHNIHAQAKLHQLQTGIHSPSRRLIFEDSDYA
jgi:hypothetical protein